MARKGIKQEKPQVEDVEEIVMPVSMNPKKKSRADVKGTDLEIPEALSFSTNSFPAMPTPSSFADDGLADLAAESGQQGTHLDSHYLRSEAPSADTGLHIVGHRVQVLVDAIQEFREFGVDHVVQLPELVLVGDQSAGKSSLMSALADIHLPQSAGCCTRCPAHIKTTPAATWTCKVSLEREYSYEPRSGRPIDSRDVTRNRPFPPWNPQQDLEVRHFMTIHDKSALEEALKWAQIATLNHTKHYSLYVPGSENFIGDESTEAKFSPNVVSVEISGPGLVPLSFYDLPGIFQNAGQKEDQYLVKVVENLAMKYICRPQALIICALPMSADPATSRTAKVIVDQNAANRCIGVLTKADQLQEGQSVVEFENMLKGIDYQLGHGYYVTKQRGHSSSLSYDENYHSEARIQENRFFSVTAPFNDKWIDFASRFGTTNLAQALSQKFAAQIVKSLPEIEIKIKRRAQEIEAELSELPELPDEQILGLVGLHLSQFSNAIQNLLEGGSSYNDFQSSWAKLSAQFRTVILDMKPRITVFDPSDSASPDIINLDDDGDDDANFSMSDSQSSARKRANEETPTPPDKKARLDPRFVQYDGANGASRTNGVNGLPHRTGSPVAARIQSPRKSVIDNEPNPFAKHINHGQNFSTIRDIRNLISCHSRTGIPGIVNDRVYDVMCMQSVTPWDKPLEDLVDMTLKSLREQADKILASVLSKWQQTQLFKQSRQHLKTFFNDFELKQRSESTALYDLETYKLFTVNTLAWEKYREEEGELLRGARKSVRARKFIQREIETRRRPPFKDENARKKAIAEVRDEQLGKDPFQTEVEVAAYVRGYYKTAALRFVDSVCLSIHGNLFKNAKKEIFYYLETRLGLHEGNAEQRCRELMEENAQVAARRNKLKKERENLNKFTDRLFQLAEENAALDAVEANGDGDADADADAEMV